jgi:hypothetical protein
VKVTAISISKKRGLKFLQMAISPINPSKSSNFNSFNFDLPSLQNERLSSRQRQETAHFPDHIGSFLGHIDLGTGV